MLYVISVVKVLVCSVDCTAGRSYGGDMIMVIDGLNHLRHSTVCQ